MKFEAFFYETSRNIKRLITIFIDSFIISLSFWLAFLVKEESLSVFTNTELWLYLAFLLPLSLIAYIKLGVYRSYQRFFGARSILFTFYSIAFSALILQLAIVYISTVTNGFIALLYFIFLGFFTAATRMTLRLIYSAFTAGSKKQLLIYGAGESGRQLAKSLVHSPEYHVAGYIDDKKSLHGYYLDGLKVHAFMELPQLIEKYAIERVLLAMPSASRSTRKRILERLEVFPVKVKTIPGLVDLLESDVKFDEIKDVEIEDLLGRDPVPPNKALFEANIKNKTVFVSGAGGSIGSELCRQIIKNQPSVLILFEVSEFALYSIESELTSLIEKSQKSIKLIAFMGSVQDKTLLAHVFKKYHVDTIYHAAAYKHVPLVEYNVVQGIKNNIFGTLYLAEAAIKANVPSFVLISTDKAVRPTNFMGTTKRVAELVLQAYSKEQSVTRFCMVRFGNVLGSSGSVIPLFRRQIKAGGPVTVTHKDITRYFMTIPEAAQLVIQAGAMGAGGDVYVLDMGESVRIYDLAKRLIRLSGLEIKSPDNPHGDIEILCTGLRPGEKLYEELLIGDDVRATQHERIMAAEESFLELNKLQNLLDQLEKACDIQDLQTIRKLLQEAPTGYLPSSSIVDNLSEA